MLVLFPFYSFLFFKRIEKISKRIKTFFPIMNSTLVYWTKSYFFLFLCSLEKYWPNSPNCLKSNKASSTPGFAQQFRLIPSFLVWHTRQVRAFTINRLTYESAAGGACRAQTLGRLLEHRVHKVRQRGLADGVIVSWRIRCILCQNKSFIFFVKKGLKIF